MLDKEDRDDIKEILMFAAIGVLFSVAVTTGLVYLCCIIIKSVFGL